MRLVPLLLVLFLTACVSAGAGKDGRRGGAVEIPVTVGPIAVTTLDAPAKVVAIPAPKPNPGPKPALVSDPAPETGPKPAVTPPVPDPPAAAPRSVSAAEKTCIRQGGSWGPAGKAGETCTKLTSDSGKQCNVESDCEGYCLARSRTCAPFKPMFGCNDILQDNGVQVTLCID